MLGEVSVPSLFSHIRWRGVFAWGVFDRVFLRIAWVFLRISADFPPNLVLSLTMLGEVPVPRPFHAFAGFHKDRNSYSSGRMLYLRTPSASVNRK